MRTLWVATIPLSLSIFSHLRVISYISQGSLNYKFKLLSPPTYSPPSPLMIIKKEKKNLGEVGVGGLCSSFLIFQSL
ncbi:hypothetical protein B0H63DRAFT_465336 [Podospora didyma]|uniref:Uncharacterized protein n=1 Tax=Podospora didyma TaxID=330526 RepID=A0AAE0NZ07_9PEZI|nr:hypothetical protein B0H63DRAFT_465336 [Podospora didyma]